MADLLQVQLTIKPHPYPEDPGAHLEAWGQVLLVIGRAGRKDPLLDWQWDLALLAEWFTENQAALAGETLPRSNRVDLRKYSIARALNLLWQREFPDDDDAGADRWHDLLYGYWRRHSLRSALPGARIPDIIIGCNRGQGEVSRSDEGGEWAYQFDMDQFCKHLSGELTEFLREWGRHTPHDSARARAHELLAQLADADIPRSCAPALRP